MARYRLAVLGGTFDHLHVGHHALLSTAFAVGDDVAVGLATDRFVAERPKPDTALIERYPVRRSALTRWLGRHFRGRRWKVRPLENAFGHSVDPEVEVLVVSRETLRGGRAVNRQRVKMGRSPVPLVVVPLVLADDLRPVSSRRVRAGEIATDGRRFTPIRVGLEVSRADDQKAAERAVLRAFPQARIVAARPRDGLGPSEVELSIRVVRRAKGGWTATEKAPGVRLRPRTIPGTDPNHLERGLLALIRPRQERKLFGTPRS